MEVIPLYTASELPPEEEQYSIIPIDRKQLSEYRSVFDTDASVYTSIDTLRCKVLGQGMRVSKGGQGGTRFSVDAATQLLFDSVWMTFFRQVMECFAIFGFAVVDQTPTGLPCCRDPLDLDIQEIRWYDQRRAWQIKHAPFHTRSVDTGTLMGNLPAMQFMPGGHHTATRQDKRTFLTTGFVLLRKEISPDGRLRSPLSRLMAPYAFQSHVLTCATRAHNRMSAPAICTQQRPRSGAADEVKRDAVDVGDAHDLAYRDGVVRHNNQMAIADMNQLMSRIMANGAMGHYSMPMALAPTRLAQSYTGQAPIDPATGTRMYPLDELADPLMSVRLPLPDDAEYVAMAAAQAPAELAAILGAVESNAAKVFVVPTTMWGSSITPQRVNENAMAVFNLAVSDWRHVMILTAKYMLGWMFGVSNARHALESNWNWNESLETNDANNAFEIQFIGALDPDILNTIQDRGFATWDVVCDLMARYYGLDRNMFTKEQIEVATGQPVRELVERQRQLEQQQVEASMAMQRTEFDMKTAQVQVAQKKAGQKPKPGEKKKEVKIPPVPAAPPVPTVDPANLTPTAMTGALTANGKTGAPGGKGRSSALSGGKAKPSGLGKRSMTGGFGNRQSGSKRKARD